jgi:hypothetical protein
VGILSVQIIQIIDPVNMTVVANITRDQNNNPLTNTAGGKNVSKVWNDAVFVQVGLNFVASACTQINVLGPPGSTEN